MELIRLLHESFLCTVTTQYVAESTVPSNWLWVLYKAATRLNCLVCAIGLNKTFAVIYGVLFSL